MTSPDIISANFHSKTTEFTKRISAYYEQIADTERLEFYEPDIDDELKPDRLGIIPTLFIRRIYWKRQQDIQLFEHTQNSKAYMMEGRLFDSRIVFGTPEMYLDIVDLTKYFQELMRRGIRLNKIERSGPYWEHTFWSGGVVEQLSL